MFFNSEKSVDAQRQSASQPAHAPGGPNLNVPILPAILKNTHTLRTYRLLLLTLLLRPFGNLSLAWGMHHIPKLLALNPIPYLQALLNPYVALGIGMLVLALLTRMALLSMADLSFVLPLTATGYIISALLGKLFLGEDVGSHQWLGTFMIFAGVAFVGTTPEKSAPDLPGQ